MRWVPSIILEQDRVKTVAFTCESVRVDGTRRDGLPPSSFSRIGLKQWVLPVSPCNLFRVDGTRMDEMGSLRPPLAG
jgi:hypothetical protein